MKRQISYIESVVCAGEKIDPKILHTELRGKREIVDRRMVVMTLALEFGNTQEETEKYFNRAHPCAINARNTIKDLCDTSRDWQIKMGVYRNIIERGITYDGWAVLRIMKLRQEISQLQNELNKMVL